jgi:chromosome segregation protein
MLKLQTLEISGFKSFVDPVTLHFAGGVTSIVGPNGCGKSNLSEAMTWVLGEQSAKSLRSGTMEDVIFNGAENRKPLGMAECTLTMATDPSFPHSEEGRLSIGRRVFRGGESQYRLNGRVVRLKEIKDLLMDTGLGIRAYSVIEQGKVGMILSGKPQERRKLLEEAAGITRYKARKNVAELKLEEATANLLRLDDIIAEIERTLRSLKRQASAARRYQEKDHEMRELLERVFLGRAAHLAARLSTLRSSLEETGSREAGLTATLHRDEAALANARERLEVLARDLAARHQRVSDLAATIEGRQEFLKANRPAQAELVTRSERDRAQAERRETEMAGEVSGLAEIERRREEISKERDDAASAVTADEQQIGAVEADLRSVSGRQESLRADLLNAGNRLQTVQREAQHAQIELEKGNFRRHHLEGELERRDADLRQAEEVLTAARQTTADLEHAHDARKSVQETVQATLQATLRREAEAADRKRLLDEELGIARQRQRLLAELARAHDEQRHVLVEALAAAGIAEPHFLAGGARAMSGWERALDAYLGAMTDAVILAPGLAALPIAETLAGRAGAILVAPQLSQGDERPTALLEDPAVLLSVGEGLGLSPEITTALPPAYLVRSAADAERLAARHPAIAFLSREGVWVQAGTFHVTGGVASPGVLERQGELSALSVSVPELTTRLGRAGSDLDEVVEERTALATEVNRLEGEATQLRQELAVARARQEDATVRHGRLTRERDEITAERKATTLEIERTSARREALAGTQAEATERQLSVTAALETAQAEVEAVKAQREALRTASAGRRGRLELLDERLEAQLREVERLRGEVDRGRRQVALWREEAERLAGRGAELALALTRADLELQEALELRAAGSDEVLTAQDLLDEHRHQVRTLDEAISQSRSAHQEVRAELETFRIDHATQRQESEHLALGFHEQFGRQLPEGPLEVEADLPALEADLAQAKATLERLGPVNALAVEEHDEQEERLTFLTTQRADVTSSVESLRKTIKEINLTSAERFRETFEAVNKTFGQLFQRLFRGGEAEMRLLDEEDVLESGIEIVARPPGKRLQNLMLLSGGEKALTAIALLFGLFATKPSPFCILDEVDAPLDDINTTRFVDLLREMSRDTQFIVITHNKLTMEVASTLYGVTMEEKGVSKLVSVQIDEVQPEPQRATA